MPVRKQHPVCASWPLIVRNPSKTLGTSSISPVFPLGRCALSNYPHASRRQEAREIGEKMVFRTHVTLHVHDTDRYGRIVADVVTKDGQNYGCEMLRQGAAWHYKAYDRREEYAQLEQEARQAGIGLWSYPRPQEPWEYRRRIRENN